MKKVHGASSQTDPSRHFLHWVKYLCVKGKDNSTFGCRGLLSIKNRFFSRSIIMELCDDWLNIMDHGDALRPLLQDQDSFIFRNYYYYYCCFYHYFYTQILKFWENG